MKPSRSDLLQWRKASYSVSGECVEVAGYGQRVFVRDSRDRDGSTLSLSPTVWRRFVVLIQQGKVCNPDETTTSQFDT